jgi:protein SCO1/2
MKLRRVEVIALIVMFVGGSLTACSTAPKSTDAQPPVASQTQAQPQRFDLEGKVVSIDKTGKKLTVDHKAIPGFMGAMTMAYPVKDDQLLENLSPGDQITAKVVSTGTDYWLENIAVTNAGSTRN